jgi:hypothetical protein
MKVEWGRGITIIGRASSPGLFVAERTRSLPPAIIHVGSRLATRHAMTVINSGDLAAPARKN